MSPILLRGYLRVPFSGVTRVDVVFHKFAEGVFYSAHMIWSHRCYHTQ